MGPTSMACAIGLTVWLLAVSVLAEEVPMGSRTALADQAGAGTGAYGLAVTGADQNYVPGDNSHRPPCGRKWVLVSASLENLAGEVVVVEREALTLIDDTGRRYAPEAASERTRPSLVGATLSRGEWLLGLALFDVPEDAFGEWLEWCPGGPGSCERPLRSSIPRTPS